MLIVVALCLIGCKSGDDANNTSATSSVTSANATPPPGRSGSGGVAPMASGVASGMTPMSGTDSVEGVGGGGVGSAAKQMAKDRAGKMSNGSMDQMPKDDTGQ
jgi:hypothetical protein